MDQNNLQKKDVISFLVTRNFKKIGYVNFKGRIVVVHTERKEISLLNELGSKIWGCCERTTSVSKVVKHLVKCFPKVSRRVIEIDTLGFVDYLVEKELLIKS